MRIVVDDQGGANIIAECEEEQCSHDCMHDAHSILCYENHAQDCRIKPIEVSDTRTQKDGTGGNNLPLVLHLSAYSFCPGMARRRGGRNRFTEELSSTVTTATGDNIPAVMQSL